MPMSHRTQLQVIKRRIRDKEGIARVRELQAILTVLPDYKNGPYADLRKWVHAQIADAREHNRVVHRESITVRRQGAAQIALVGAPNAGKSSLMQALSDVQIETGDYAFTTTRPLPAVIRTAGVLVQLVEIPGLIVGAADDRAGGKALLSVLRSADAMVVCHSSTEPAARLHELLGELRAAAIDLPAIGAITKSDDASPAVLGVLRAAMRDAGLECVEVSVIDEEALDRFRQAVWDLTGLHRVFLRHLDETTPEPIAVAPPVTVADVARAIHGELAARCRGARIWGASARFDGQRVGPHHVVADGDTVEIVT
jgi:small GTP-binding protein